MCSGSTTKGLDGGGGGAGLSNGTWDLARSAAFSGDARNPDFCEISQILREDLILENEGGSRKTGLEGLPDVTALCLLTCPRLGYANEHLDLHRAPEQ